MRHRSTRVWLGIILYGWLAIGLAPAQAAAETQSPRAVQGVIDLTSPDVFRTGSANLVRQPEGGLRDSPGIGTPEESAAEREKKLMLRMFILGSLLMMGGYHIVLYGLRRTDKSPLFFGLTCFAVAFRTFVIGETPQLLMYPGLDWDLATRAEYAANTIILPLFIRFCHELYHYRMSRHLSNLSMAVGAMFSLLVLCCSARVYMQLMPYYLVFGMLMLAYLIYACLSAWLQKREGAMLHFFALLFFCLTVVNDVLYHHDWIHTREMIPFGLLAFLFAQAVNLSIKFTRSFIRNEQLSDELVQLNELLEEKVRERTLALEQSMADLSRMEQSRRALLSNVTHELRTPLTSIQGYAQALMDGVVTADHGKYFRLILDKAQLLDRIFKDLLELSKLEARKIDFQFQLLPAGPLIRDLFGKFEWEAEHKGIRMELGEWDDYIEEADVYVDPKRLEQVFGNLIANALQFTPSGGKVRVTADIRADDPHASCLIVRVADSGCGILKEDIPYIFDRFYRGKQSRRANAGGAGLGLAIVKEIVEMHDGRIEVESERNVGSAFDIVLPVRMGVLYRSAL